MRIQLQPDMHHCHIDLDLERGTAPVTFILERRYAGTKFRQMLRAGEDIPEWFAFKSVVRVLREQVQSEAN